jgi:tRNA dimethylallyltransferase
MADTAMNALPHALIVAGPTASGKSALAIAIAEHVGGTIINTDSMQVYRELRVLTARPTAEDEAQVPHRLYGIRPAAEAGSVAWWRDQALAAMDEARAGGRLPILTGGTGMYFAALTDGLTDIPDPGPDARAEARRLLAEQGAAALHGSLTHVDPATAARLNPEDSQRIARAWEVWRGTGLGLAAWQTRRSAPAPWRFTAIRLDPPRDVLRVAIATRFGAMVRDGVIDEVSELLALNLDPSLPAMRAHGVEELSAYLAGTATLEEAGRRTELITGQYTKRQATWFRHRALASQTRTFTINSRFTSMTQFSERERSDLFTFIENEG